MAITNNDTESVKDRAREFAEGFAASVAPDLVLTACVTADEGDNLTIAFEGEDAARMVGRNGQVLDALGFIASQALNRRGSARIRIQFDADNYRAKREATLVKLATEVAEQVIASGNEAVLDPLSPAERRIIHNVLTEMPGVRTYSEGEEPNRYIIISPA